MHTISKVLKDKKTTIGEYSFVLVFHGMVKMNGECKGMRAAAADGYPGVQEVKGLRPRRGGLRRLGQLDIFGESRTRAL